ncbi:hypothetical protein PG988_015404 [Apiospora saccharicola]
MPEAWDMVNVTVLALLCYLPPRRMALCCAIAKVTGLCGSFADSIGPSPKLTYWSMSMMAGWG